MKIAIKLALTPKQKDAFLIIGVFEGGQLSPSAKAVDDATRGYIKKMLVEGIFQGKAGQTLSLFPMGISGFERIILVGCGTEQEIAPTVFRKIATASIKSLKMARAKNAICYLSELSVKGQSAAWKVRQITEAVYEGLYSFDEYKSTKEPSIALKEFILLLPEQKQQKACEEAVNQGQIIGEAVNLTKNLANTPSNICTPLFLADEARSLGKRMKSISVKVLNEKEMEKLGMGALLAVSQGSAQDAKLVCLEYWGGKKSEAPVALVGKGVTFDTGGNSLKTPENMLGMKYDMCGAATVLSTLQAAAQLKLKINLIGIMAVVENMPGGTAYKPDDILKSMSGQTIEIISTDAEGRVILADALTYCERFKPDVVIDIATLTGAVVIALGAHATGLLSNNDELAADLLKAGKESNDRAWQLPLWDEYQEQIKSPFADMTNSGGRMAGTITAACFLSRFAKKFRWAHLDVAGTAASFISGGIAEEKATGRPVPLLVQYLLNRENNG